MTIEQIIIEMRALCDADATSYPASALTDIGTIRINEAYKKVIGWIINADATWQWDDTNQSDQPRGKGTLVEGQEAYTFASDYLQIEAMDVMDLNNHYIRLKPLDQSELGGLSPDEYFGLESGGTPKKGMPEYYDLFTDDSFRLYPAPSTTYCTLTNGYRVWFKRNPVTFTAAEIVTGSKEPGFAINHNILSYMSAIPYCMTYKKDRVASYQLAVGDFDRPSGMKAEIINHYSKREKEKRKQITFKRKLFK
jgi:hypothetical protein